MKLVFLLSILSVTPMIAAHPGGLDANGGHTNRKTGEYHSHRGGPSASRPAAKPQGVAPNTYRPTTQQSIAPAQAVQTPSLLVSPQAPVASSANASDWKINPLQGAQFQHGMVQTSGTQQLILIGQTYYPAEQILNLRSIGNIGIVSGNPPNVHWWTCPTLAGQKNVTVVELGTFAKSLPESYCKTCLEWRDMHGLGGTTVKELFKKAGN